VVFKHTFLVLVIDVRRDLVDRIITQVGHSLFVVQSIIFFFYVRHEQNQLENLLHASPGYELVHHFISSQRDILHRFALSGKK
jgi:acetone carboxylase gamma subunit